MTTAIQQQPTVPITSITKPDFIQVQPHSCTSLGKNLNPQATEFGDKKWFTEQSYRMRFIAYQLQMFFCRAVSGMERKERYEIICSEKTYDEAYRLGRELRLVHQKKIGLNVIKIEAKDRREDGEESFTLFYTNYRGDMLGKIKFRLT